MSDEKKTDVVTELLKQKAQEKAATVTEYSMVDAVQILNRIVLDAMVTNPTARTALREGDYTSNISRQRVGIAIQNLGVNAEALNKALEEADKLRRRG